MLLAAGDIGGTRTTLAAELLQANIIINGVLPRTIANPQNRQPMPKADNSRWTLPEAIADMVLVPRLRRCPDGQRSGRAGLRSWLNDRQWLNGRGWTEGRADGLLPAKKGIR